MYIVAPASWNAKQLESRIPSHGLSRANRIRSDGSVVFETNPFALTRVERLGC